MEAMGTSESLRLVGGRNGPPVLSSAVRTGTSLNDADPVRIVLVERKQRLLGSDHAVGVIFSVVAEKAHGDPLRHGANRPVVAGEIFGIANFAGLARAVNQLLDLAALAGVEDLLVSVEGRIELRAPLFYLRDSTPQRAALCAGPSSSRGICKLPDAHAAQLPRTPVPDVGSTREERSC